MKQEIPMFEFLVIETSSYCNRKCRTCLRQNDPEKSRWWPDGKPIKEIMETKTVHSILDQAWNMGFKGLVCFVYYNEPLLDPRTPMFAEYAKNKGFQVQVTTNGDYLTPELIERLDKTLDRIEISIYDRSRYAEKKDRFEKLFKKTQVISSGLHWITHYSPHVGLDNLIQAHRNYPCPSVQRHFIINYKGDHMLCCEDLGNFGLGNVHESSLKELWFGEKHAKIVTDLQKPKGRLKYPYCSICPIYLPVKKPRVEVQQ